jgi:hypothetical protein
LLIQDFQSINDLLSSHHGYQENNDDFRCYWLRWKRWKRWNKRLWRTKGSGASSGLDKGSNVIGTSIGTTGTAEGVVQPTLIAKIISLCGIPEDCKMVMSMFKKKWKELYHILCADFDDINAFHTVKKDFKTVYIRMFKCLLLYYKRKCREMS